MNKIELEDIISQESYLTDRARFELGDVYELTKELLISIQCLESFSRENEVSKYFDSQIMSGFFNSVLSTIRRHTNNSFLILRQVIENISLFIFSMELQKLSDYKVIIIKDQIVKYDKTIRKKAYTFVENKYPEYSFKLEVLNKAISHYYAHANISNSQSNTVIIDDRIKALFFDSYFQDYIREVLFTINDLMILMLKIYISLSKDYSIFVINNNIEKELHEYEKRHEKIKNDLFLENEQTDRIFFEEMDNIIKKYKEKYKDKLPPDYF